MFLPQVFTAVAAQEGEPEYEASETAVWEPGEDVAADDGDCLFCSPKRTGDWFGARSDLAENGVTFF